MVGSNLVTPEHSPGCTEMRLKGPGLAGVAVSVAFFEAVRISAYTACLALLSLDFCNSANL